MPFSLFHCIIRFIRFDLFEVFARSSLFLFAKTTKIFSLSFAFRLTFEIIQKDFLFSLVCFVFRVQLESVMAFNYISYVRSCK